MRDRIKDVQENIRKITTATEMVKNELAGGLWERQQRWEQKKRTYVQLLQAAGAMVISHRRAFYHYERSGGTEFDLDVPVEVIERFQEAVALACIFAAPEVQALVNRPAEADASFFGQNKGVRDRLHANLNAYQALCNDLIELARKDLTL